MFNFARKTSLNNLTNSRNNLFKQTLQKQNLSYLNKHIKIPFADKILSKEQYEKYELYEHVKKADFVWLEEYLKNNNSSEKYNEVINCIKYTKENPTNIMNFVIGGTSFYFGTNIWCLSLSSLAIGYSFGMVGMDMQSAAFTCAGVAELLLGYKCLEYGGTTLLNELKAPHNDYDKMIKMCENETNKNIM